MITAKFNYKRGKLSGVEVSGHATRDFDDIEGKLLCAFVSSACLMASNTATEIIGDKGEEKSSAGYMKYSCENPSDYTVKVLEGLLLHLTELKKQYGNRIEIITEV